MKKLIFFIGVIVLTFASCESLDVVYEDAICIENISTIDAKNGLLANQTVIIKNGKILQIESSNELKLSQKNNIIDGTGKFLIPGLWDTHIHFAYIEELAPNMFDLFLAYGVTSIRDTGGQIDFVKQWKDKSLTDPTNTPRVMIAGPLLDGMPNVYNGSDADHPPLSYGLSSVDAVVQQVHNLDSIGVDFLKAYEMLNPEQFTKITQLAKEKGLKVTGHVPLSMDVISASNAGLNSMEHMRNLEMSIASNAEELLEERRQLLAAGKNDIGSVLRSRIHSAQRMIAIENYDDSKATEVLQVLAKNETWQIPTLALYNAIRTKESFQYLPDSIRKDWEKGILEMEKIETPPEREIYAKWMMHMVGKIHQNKIEIMAGTDTPIYYLTPGLSLHDELDLFVKSGLTPLEALKTATLNPATYFNLDSELGWIGENTWADLLILNANPLEDINNTKQIDAVIKQGNFFDRKKLDEILKNVSQQ